MIGYVLIPIIIVLSIIILFSGIFTVKQQSSAVLERFGKFLSIRNSGLHFKIPIIDQIAGRINLKVQQLDVLVETKTKDDVFVKAENFCSVPGD
jgi:regulator of protease activity HflC (stomatin/prohibitin superfamily)